ncbi:MAG: dTMP kinase [Pseudomonadota bacterium]|jgi:dTMP kinase|nr:MAG: dTMP kinase [Pseudomonadota bacterium]
MARGKFITFEGGEGAGKSTQARLLAERLRAKGIQVVLTREPGGSAFAEQVRELILSPNTADHGPLAETLLFSAARADHLERTIRPALEAGHWVVCDRFSDSTRVYQGVAGGVPKGVIEALERIVVDGTVPDVTFVLDLPAAEGLARAQGRNEHSTSGGAFSDSYEDRPLSYHERLRDGFLMIATAEPERCVVVDATQRPEEVAEQIWGTIEMRLLQPSE